MTSERTITRHSKKLSWLLRHGANSEGLAMDTAGWARVEDVLSTLRLSRQQLDVAVAHNNKSRFDVDGDFIRASQGHSLETTPITQEGLEGTWATYSGQDVVWHGTNVDAVDGIAREGILRGRRSHVHLAETRKSKVGKRANVHVMLGVSVSGMRSEGVEVFKSPNGVVLARYVPVGCIVSLEALTRRAKDARNDLSSLLNLRA